jgi:hypothetical protein
MFVVLSSRFLHPIFGDPWVDARSIQPSQPCKTPEQSMKGQPRIDGVAALRTT